MRTRGEVLAGDNVLALARSDIEDGSPARRHAVAHKWIARVRDLEDPLVEKMRAIVIEFRRTLESWIGEVLPPDTLPYADQEDEERSRKLTLGGLTAVAFELMLTIYVSISFLNFFWLLAALIGIVAAIFLALLIETVLTLYWRPELPRGSVERLSRWIWWPFWMSLGGIGLLLIARTNPWLAPVADIALAILSLALPTLAGAFFILAHIYGRFGRLERRYGVLRDKVSALQQLRRELTRYLPKEVDS